MDFLVPDYKYCDLVHFHIRNDFSDKLEGIITRYIDRRDRYALLHFTKEYMDTNVTVKRPDTPAYLIIDSVPNDYYMTQFTTD